MITLALLIAMTALFILVITEKDLFKAVVYLAGSGVCITVIFFLLRAPDIAITKAAVGVILVTVIFVVAIEKTRRFEE